MTPEDMRAIVRAYSDRYARFGVSPETLGWGRKDRRRLRFEVLCSLWAFDGASVLDFGCGFGDLCGFLMETRTGVQYLGVDINPDLVDAARRLQPSGRFDVANLLDDSQPIDVDFVLASGVFNDRIGDNWTFIERAFAAFNRVARRGFAANFLSARVDYRYPDAYYAEPADVLNLCYRYSRNVVLRNDCMPFEFTVFVNKDARVDPDLAIFEGCPKRL